MFVLLIIIRLLAPLLILRWPLFGSTLAIIADAYDFKDVCSAIGPHNYQYLDKLLDTYFLTIAAVASLKWIDIAAKRAVIALYCYRLGGVILFFVTGKEYILFFFPNIMLDFFIFYLIYRAATKQEILIRNRFDLALILFVILVPKLLSEYYLHVYHLVSIPIPAILRYFYECSDAIQYLIYLFIPVTYLGWRIFSARRKNDLKK